VVVPAQLVDGVDEGHARMALAAQFDVQHHGVVALAARAASASSRVNHWSITMPLRALRIHPANWLLVGRSSSITAIRVMGACQK
jgi:hypothetical protein